MKKLNLLLAATFLCASISQAQITTVTYKPGPAIGSDAGIMTSYGCTLNGQPGPSEGLNSGNAPEMDYMDWTFNAGGCPHGTLRSLVQFTQLSSIPATATILSATLTLRGVTSSGNWGNSSFPGSPYGTTNEGWLEQVTSAWAEGTVTWNTQPTTNAATHLPLPVTTLQFGYTASINVTGMVANMVATGNNFGFMAKLQNEATYRSVLLATSDNADSTLWPELTVQYAVCYADFNLCTSTSTPYTYTFTDANPQPGDVNSWTIDGVVVSSATSFSYTFPGPGSHTICQSVSNSKGRYQCSKCYNLCIAQNQTGPRPAPGADHTPTTGTVPQMIPEKMISDRDIIRVADISPNPSSTGWNLSIKSVQSTTVEISIYDLQGNMLSKEQRKLERGDNRIFESGEKMGMGMYLIEIKSPNFTVRERLQKGN